MSTDKQITFGPFRLDVREERLWCGAQPLSLRPKAFAVLKCLIGRAGQLVTKEQLLREAWPDTFVTDAVLKDSIRQLREVLGDDAAAPRYIETAHRRGYRFIWQLGDDEPSPGVERQARGNPAPAAQSSAPALPAADNFSTARVLGRAAPLSSLRGWLGRALGGQRQIVFVTGEPGIGKTTLVESFFEGSAITQGTRTARGQCLEQYGAGEAYLPVLDALSRLCRGAEGVRVVELLRQYAPTWLAQMPSLVATAEREALRQEVLGATRERMLRELAEAFEALTVQTPLVLVLEDLHWSDYSTLELISYLARRHDPARLMLIGTYRPVEVILSDHPLKGVKRELQAHDLCRELPLEYLSEEIIAQYLSLRFPEHEFPALLARMIHRRTEGNPLFMINVVNYLQDEMTIVEHKGRWRLAANLAGIELGVPENIRQLIEKQIERLGPEEQRVLEGASVVGMECSTVAIAAGLNADLAWVEERCEELVRRHGFLSPARLVELPDGTITPRYKFMHVLYLEVPYECIPALRRAEIHRRIGACGELIYGESVSEIAAELAMHFEQARDWPRAAKYLSQAAENAARRFAHHESAALARRGLDALTTLPKSDERDGQELALRMVLGVALMALKGFADPEVKSVYLSARALCGRQRASAQQYSVLWSLGLFYYFRAETREALGSAEQLLDLAVRLHDPALIMEAHRALGVVLVETADFAAARQHLEQASALYLTTQQHPHLLMTAHDTMVVVQCFAARVLWSEGYPDQALHKVNEALRLAAQHAHTESQVLAAHFSAHIHQLRREATLTRERAETLIALAEEYGLEMWKSFGVINRGWAMAEQGQVEAGIEQMRRGLASYEATGAQLWRPHFLGLLAAALAKVGRVEEGLAAITEALTAVHNAGEHYSEAELHRIKGELLVMKVAGVGEAREAAPRPALAETASLPSDEIRRCFDRALSVAQRQQSKAWELRAAISVARLYQRQGERAAARQLLAKTIGQFTEGLETADLREARDLLE